MGSVYSIAILAGMLAAFNPCGFAMLPAYLGVQILGQSTDEKGNYLRALKFSFGMGVGLLATFTAFGFLVIPFAGAIERYLPWVTVGIAILLLVTGVAILFGNTIGLTRLFRPSIAPTKGLWSQIGYGVTYALASLSCTIGPFLAVTATAIRSSSWLEVLITFALYGAGMSAIIFLLALLTASSSQKFIIWTKQKGKLLERLIAGFLILVSVYLFIYGVFEIRVAAGDLSSSWLIGSAVDAQSFLARFIYGIGPLWILVFIAILSLISFWGWRRTSRTKSEEQV